MANDVDLLGLDKSPAPGVDEMAFLPAILSAALPKT
jgi:hypothetical protein